MVSKNYSILTKKLKLKNPYQIIICTINITKEKPLQAWLVPNSNDIEHISWLEHEFYDLFEMISLGLWLKYLGIQFLH
jgi:hypothetical protein